MPENGVVTIFSFDRKTGEYVRKGVFPSWVRRRLRSRGSKAGTYCCDDFDVRIALNAVDEINVGDMIYFGELKKSDFSMGECRRVAVVSRNDFGLNPHWHLESEREYR